jgi:hypothetical protein
LLPWGKQSQRCRIVIRHMKTDVLADVVGGA